MAKGIEMSTAAMRFRARAPSFPSAKFRLCRFPTCCPDITGLKNCHRATNSSAVVDTCPFLAYLVEHCCVQLVGFLLEYEEVRLNRSMFHRSFYQVSNSFQEYCPYQLLCWIFYTLYLVRRKSDVLTAAVLVLSLAPEWPSYAI